MKEEQTIELNQLDRIARFIEMLYPRLSKKRRGKRIGFLIQGKFGFGKWCPQDLSEEELNILEESLIGKLSRKRG